MTKLNKSRKFIATSATAALVASAIVPVASAAQINDFNSISSYAQEAVQDLNDRGVIKGDQKGNFNPKNNVTRAEAATILVNALGLEGSGSTNFADVKTNAWYFDAIDAAVANGIFQGQGNNKFNPSGNLTRSEAAIILVDAFGLEGSADLSEFKDSASVKAWAQEALEIAVANGVMKGDAGNLKPNAAISRQDFAVMYHRTEALETEEEVVAGSVKAINNTTVEVTFEEAVTELDELNFAIEGLTISNKAVKQTNSKTVVLTTSAQTADVDYTVTVNGEAVGTFKGVSAVIPTAVSVVEFQNPVVEKETTQVNSHKSQQAPLGTQVTLKAQVKVADGQSKAGIPVTFNIIDGSNTNTAYASLNQPILAEATTDENGVATYTYTRYASTAQALITNDEVQVYATGNPTARDFSKVYWANTQPLTITEVTTGNKLNNGSKKVYKVKLAGVNRANELEHQTGARYINVGFLDNVNIAPDKANKGVTVTDASGRNLGYPGQFTTTNSTDTNRFNAVRINLDANGEATFTLTGSNETVTPFVWHDNAVGNTNATIDRFDKTELVAFAAPVTFTKEQVLNVKIESLGTKDASAYQESFDNSGAYEYTNGSLVLVRDPNGRLTGALPNAIPAGAVKINQNNPVRSNEVIPAGYTYVALTTTGISGVVALENNLGTGAGHLSKYAYTGTVKAKQAALVADLQNTGGRDYKVSYTDKDGKAAQSGQVVKVELKYGSAKTNATAAATPIYFIDNNSHTVYKVSDFNKETAEFSLTTNAKGQVSFTVIGGRDSYATPTAFLETGDKAGLDKNDAQEVGEIAYFGDRTINSAKLTIDNEDTVTKSVSEEVTFSYQSTDQNKKHYFTQNNANFIATFQVSTTFAPAVVTYTDRNGDTRTETVNQGSTKSFDVRATNGKADIKVTSTRGNRVDVVASANSLPILNASATFTTLNNEGIAFGQSVRGKVVAVDTANKRILLTDSKGEKVYDLSYEDANLFYKGASGASESTFESYLNVGDELYFTQKADDNSKAKFDNLDITSGIKVDTANVNRTFIIDGDYTSTVNEYDFAYAGSNSSAITTSVNANFQINGDNIKLKNVNIIGDVTVGNTNATEAQVLNDFALDNVTVTGTVTVNQGDGDTFTITGNSKLNRVVTNIKEHIAIAAGSEITTLVATKTGTSVTGVPGLGAGTVEQIVASTGVVVEQKDGINAPIVTEEVALFTAKTTSGDTVELTFTAGSNVTGITSTNIGTVAGTVATTTTDVATITFANTAVAGKTIDVTFNHNGVTKTYTLAIGTVGNAATITRKY